MLQGCALSRTQVRSGSSKVVQAYEPNTGDPSLVLSFLWLALVLCRYAMPQPGTTHGTLILRDPASSWWPYKSHANLFPLPCAVRARIISIVK